VYGIFYILQFVIFAMGVASVLLSGYFIAFFSNYKSHRNMGLRFTMQLFLGEQIITSIGTLIFASASLMAAIGGVDYLRWNSLSPEVSTAIRAAMFGAMLLSTLKLTHEVRKIAAEQERNNE
jgi:hypothetical protein